MSGRLRIRVPVRLDVEVHQGVKTRWLLMAGLFALVLSVASACASDGGDLVGVASDGPSAEEGAIVSPSPETTGSQ